MILSSYRKAVKSSGQVTVLRDIETNVSGRDVLLIDDILESGRTLAFAKDLLAARGARTTYTAVLLNKPGHLAAHIEADFQGFSVPTSSSSAMAWTWRTSSVNCPSWATLSLPRADYLRPCSDQEACSCNQRSDHEA
jgi:hypoxanthine phosphoribosyltransferase